MKIKFNIILVSLFFMGVSLIPLGIVCKGDGGHSIALVEVHASSGGGGHGAHPAPPVKYYIHWFILLVSLFSVARYLKKKFAATLTFLFSILQIQC